MSEAYKKACEQADAKGFRLLPQTRATQMGFSRDKRVRRRQHRRAARALIGAGTFLNPGKAPRGSGPNAVAMWHLFQARYWGR